MARATIPVTFDVAECDVGGRLIHIYVAGALALTLRADDFGGVEEYTPNLHAHDVQHHTDAIERKPGSPLDTKDFNHG